MEVASNHDQQNNVTLFAKTNFRGNQVPFGIKRDDRRKHTYIIGKTGMGKSTMMENMVIQDIINGEGLALVDPHGDLVNKVLDYIPAYRINDVIYFNPADTEYPIAFNILESVDPRYKHLVASGLMGVFTKIWAGVWSPRMEYILNNSILALLDSPGNSLLGLARMLVDKKYRKRIVDNIKDPMVRSFWIDEFANWPDKYRQEAIAPIQNKVGQFLSSGIIRNIVGQAKSTLDLREVMDNRKILLMNLSKGSVGEDNSALLGAMLITKLQLAALSRVDIPEHERKDFYLYVDEFQNFATESFATILSEARKYRLNLIIGHQYIGQLIQDRNNTKVRDAVFGNVGTIVTFRVGAADAEFLEKEFAPQFTENDLVNLPKHNILLKLMINGVASDPFTAETLPPALNEPTDNTQKIIRVSRERYANPAADVEDKIMRWMGQEFHEGVAVIASGAAGGETGEEDDEEELSPAKVEEKLLASQNVGTVEVPVAPLAEPIALTVSVEAKTPEQLKSESPRVEQKPESKHQEHRAEHVKEESKKSDNQSKKKDHKHPKKDKDTNPIWDKVANLNQKGAQKEPAELVSKLEKGLENIFIARAPKPDHVPTEIERDVQEEKNAEVFEEQVESFVQAIESDKPQVLKPGQAAKLEDI